MPVPKYIIRFFFDWGTGCLWPGNDACYDDFGFGPYDDGNARCPLPLSEELLERCDRMSEWHDTALNWDYPPDPSPWRQDECDRFNGAVEKLLADIRNELGSNFEIIDRQGKMAEDKDLDKYLADPKGFRSSSERNR